VYDNDRQLIGSTTLFMEDVKVPDAAQTTFSLGANYEIIKGLRVYASYYFADRIFADFDIATDNSFTVPGNQAWELPYYDLVDGGISYNFPVGGLDFTFNLNVNNVFNKEYMAESESNILYDPANEDDREVGENGSVFNRVYYGFGRTWNTSLKMRF
jgi:iron complex outermembrane recepter protein